MTIAGTPHAAAPETVDADVQPSRAHVHVDNEELLVLLEQEKGCAAVVAEPVCMLFAEDADLMLCETQLVQITPEGAEHFRKGGILHQLVHYNRSFFRCIPLPVELPIFEVGVDASLENVLGLRQGLRAVAFTDGDGFFTARKQTKDGVL